MQPWNEADYLAYCEVIRATYREAGRVPDDYYPVWPGRATYDYCAGLSWKASCRKHEAECRAALGLPAPPAPPITIPTGRVQLVNGAFHDSRGPFNPIGASFFPAGWAYRYDQGRFLQNVEFLAPYLDFVRIWGQVGGGPWVDRAVNPNWLNYERIMADTLDALLERGLRTEITILAGAGAEGAETPQRRIQLLDQTLAYVSGREEAVQLLEIANESVGLGVEELRVLARYLASRTTIPVAITSVPQVSSTVYEGMRGVVELATAHYDRDVSKADGYDRPTRQPWGYPDEYYPGVSGFPAQAIDNEGIGPYSSVAEDKDPLRNITRRVVAWIAGNPASVYHCGPGIYFGGQGAVRSGSPANFMDVPGIEDTLRGFRVLRGIVPQGISGWQRSNNAWPNYPWVMQTGVGEGMFSSGVGCVRAYATSNGQQVVCVPFGIKDHVTLGEKRPMSWSVYSLLTAEVLQQGSGPLTLPQTQGEAQLILGTYR